MLTINCDGGSRGNPGHAAGAFVIYRGGEVLHKDSKYLGVATNNVAEYQALVLALTYLNENLKTLGESEEINFVLDSELVTKQMQGLYKVKNENLKNYFQSASDLAKNIPVKISFTWKRRSENVLADELVNAELDRQEMVKSTT